MGVKLTGKQLKAFVNSDWGDPDAFWDDVCYVVDGVEIDPLDGIDESKVADDAKIEITDGVVYVGEKSLDAVRFVKKWLRGLSHVTVSFDVPREKEAAFREYVRGFDLSEVR